MTVQLKSAPNLTRNLPYHRHKVWNRAKTIASRIDTSMGQQGTLISTARYTDVDGAEEAYDVDVLSFDVDLKDTDPRYLKAGRCDRKPLYKAIKKAFQGLQKHFQTCTVTRNGGFSLGLAFPAFKLSDSRLSLMALELQRRLGCMLRSIGIGVDVKAYGLCRDVPNPYSRENKSYRSKRKDSSARLMRRKNCDGSPIRHVIADLLEFTEEYRSIWTLSKKAKIDEFIYPDARLEKKLIPFYLDSKPKEFYSSQKQLSEAMKVCPKTLRSFIESDRLAWLSIAHDEGGYCVTVTRSDVLNKRAEEVLRGDMKEWVLPFPEHVEKGSRNEYIWRCAVTMKFQRKPISLAMVKMEELIRRIPSRRLSKSCANFRSIVSSIYANQRIEEGVVWTKLKPIPGLDGDVSLALGTKLRKAIYDRGGVIRRKRRERLNVPS